ncbi:MAG: quinone oxidoreductase [Proteobacteria bacterium]|nr:quinone oxidoreductase [Pseudomonadota bacterium]
MQKVVIRDVGGPGQLKLEDAAEPRAGADEVLVKVSAAGINYVDVYQRKGIYKLPLPYTPGFEGMGTITAVGSNVKQLRVGQQVAWIDTLGSYSQMLAIPASHAIALPDSFKAGDALLFQGVTAQYLMAEYRALTAGDWVLVHSAAGGVGQLLVQWAKHLGATVVGTTSSSQKAERVRALGADYVIDYSKSDFLTEVLALTNKRGVDIVFDGVGHDTFERSVQSLARGGTAVCYGAASGPSPKIDPHSLVPKALRVAGGSIFGYIADVKQLQARSRAVIEGIQQGWLKQGAPAAYALGDAHRAHSDIEGRGTQGKLMLVP